MKKRWAAALATWILVAYLASFGPAFYLAARFGTSDNLILSLYSPIVAATSGRPADRYPHFVNTYRAFVNDCWRKGKQDASSD